MVGMGRYDMSKALGKHVVRENRAHGLVKVGGLVRVSLVGHMRITS